MIVVTGTHRSGTSLWMQILVAAGLPVLGHRFPGRFSSLHTLNENGFYETRLRYGLNASTNPDPYTGVWLDPDTTRHLAIKVFVSGLVQTEACFLDRVIATVRPWREHARSVQRLYDLEDDAIRARGGPHLEQRLAERASWRSLAPIPVTWWFQVHALVLDMAYRSYPFHLTTFDRVLRDPHQELTEVLTWLGEGDLEDAVAAVQPKLRSFNHDSTPPPNDLTAEDIAVMDDVYTTIDQRKELDTALIRRMNALQERLAERWPEEVLLAGLPRATS